MTALCPLPKRRNLGGRADGQVREDCEHVFMFGFIFAHSPSALAECRNTAAIGEFNSFHFSKKTLNPQVSIFKLE